MSTTKNTGWELADLADDLSGELAWTPGLGWLCWDGKVWNGARQKTGGQVTSVPAQRVNQWMVENNGYRPLDATPLRSALRQLQACLETREDAFDAHPHLLNVRNGVVNLRTGELRPHDQALRMTKLTAVDYDPAASSPEWDQVLTAVSDSGRTRLQVAHVGSAVTGEPGYRVPVLYGPGPTGKTTFVRALANALGTHAVILPGLTADRVGDLRGVRLAVAEDVSTFDPAALKQAMSPDLRAVRHPHRNGFTYRPTHSLFITASTWPPGWELDEGTRRRLRSETFSIPGDLDPALRQRTCEPETLRAALRWAVDGAVRWYATNDH